MTTQQQQRSVAINCRLRNADARRAKVCPSASTPEPHCSESSASNIAAFGTLGAEGGAAAEGGVQEYLQVAVRAAESRVCLPKCASWRPPARRPAQIRGAWYRPLGRPPPCRRATPPRAACRPVSSSDAVRMRRSGGGRLSGPELTVMAPGPPTEKRSCESRGSFRCPQRLSTAQRCGLMQIMADPRTDSSCTSRR